MKRYLQLLAERGAGPAALYPALTWQGRNLAGLQHPDLPSWDELALLGEQLERLGRNTQALLAGAGAHNVLLYGPRGSGKSTAVRGLLGRFAGSGLRLVELPPAELAALPALVERLRRQPTSFVIFVDDLAFEAEDAAYRPLKSLLEGSLSSTPANVIVLATSNRRHLVRERHSDRPAPEDDVHGWDTHHERLALADRFGLTITFPSAGQRGYLEMVRALAALRGVGAVDTEKAIQFAEWGNGYSGRTARQFVDDQVQSSAARASEAASS
jgi:predicted AAA+ superfamily ATPase